MKVDIVYGIKTQSKSILARYFLTFIPFKIGLRPFIFFIQSNSELKFGSVLDFILNTYFTERHTLQWLAVQPEFLF